MTTAVRINEIRAAHDRCLDDTTLAAYKAWARNVGATDFDDFEDAYNGEWATELEFTEQLVDDLGMLDSMPENLRGYFDYDAFKRDLFMSDYYSITVNYPTGLSMVFVFRNI